ncbi:MAG: YqjF family protein [Micromonosporaceae bacterium]
MAEPLTEVTPRPVRLAVLAQWWRRVSFVHWEAAPNAVAHLMPAGVRPDTIDGVTYVGLVAFRMERTRLFGMPPMPYLGTFEETNVRLYSVDGQGRRGVVFLSMDASRLAPVVAARAVLGLPYRWSSMRLDADHGAVTYTCRPVGHRQRSSLTVEYGEPIKPSPLEVFLTARWGLHTGRRHLGNEHQPWPLTSANLISCDDHLIAAAGLPGVADQPPASVLYSPGVHARFGPSRAGSSARTR